MNRAIALLALAVLSCGGPPTKGLEELISPVFIWQHWKEECVRVRAMEDEGRLWSRSTCGGDDGRLEQGGRLSTSELGIVRASFGRLRDSPVAGTAACPVTAHVFKVYRPSDTFDWFACGSSTTLGKVDGLEDPFLAAAESLSQ